MSATEGDVTVAIDAIAPYPMPSTEDLPKNTAAWTVDPDRAALLIHDMQEYFLAPFPSAASPRAELVHNTTRLLERCRELGIPVGYTAQPGSMSEVDRGLLKDFWGPGMAMRPEHRKIIEPISPVEGDWVFTKWRYSAFHRSDLAKHLAAAGRDQLVVCGVYAHVGVMMTACDAFTRDVETFVVADAVADFSAEYHRMALSYSAERCAVVATTDTVLDWMARPPRVAG